MRPPEVPMLPYVMMPRPLQESNVIGKAGTAGFLGRAYDPYYLYPPGDDLDMAKMDRINIDDLVLRKDVPQARLERRAHLRDMVNASLRDLDRAVKSYALDTVLRQGAQPGPLRPRPRRLQSQGRKSWKRATDTAATRLANAACWLAAWSKPAPAWSKSTGPRSPTPIGIRGTSTSGLSERMKNENSPMLDAGLSALIADLDERGMLKDTLVVAVGEFGRSPKRGVSTSGNSNTDDGRDHWPYCYTAVVAGAGVKRGFVYGKSDKTASSPVENPVHPMELLATVYHSVGLDAATDDLQPPQPAARNGEG